MTQLDDKVLSLSPGALVELYDLDLSPIDGPYLRFTPAREELTPGQVWNVLDNANNAIVMFGCPTPIVGDAGDRMVFDGYVRRVGASGWGGIRFSTAPDGGGDYVDLQWNPNNHATSWVVGGTNPLQDQAARFTTAAEWAYFSVVYTAKSLSPIYINFMPAMGGTYASRANNARISMDVFGWRAAAMLGGTRVPRLLEQDMSLWSRSAAGSATLVDNTAQMVKVPVWNNNAYTPIPIKATGFEKSGTGPFPRPKITMSNLFNEGSALAQEFGDLRGAVVVRRRVYADFLDNGPNPDGASGYPPDIFTVDRKALQDSQTIEWELSSVLEQSGVMLPRRQILRDVCPWIYRVWDGTKFVYADDEGCPYTGAAMFNENGAAVTNPENDKCSHTMALGCRKRYGKKQEIPFGGFPMVGRLST